jgi:hypothetical protein
MRDIYIILILAIIFLTIGFFIGIAYQNHALCNINNKHLICTIYDNATITGVR